MENKFSRNILDAIFKSNFHCVLYWWCVPNCLSVPHWSTRMAWLVYQSTGASETVSTLTAMQRSKGGSFSHFRRVIREESGAKAKDNSATHKESSHKKIKHMVKTFLAQCSQDKTYICQ